jgi:hypothetical protein
MQMWLYLVRKVLTQKRVFYHCWWITYKIHFRSTLEFQPNLACVCHATLHNLLIYVLYIVDIIVFPAIPIPESIHVPPRIQDFEVGTERHDRENLPLVTQMLCSSLIAWIRGVVSSGSPDVLLTAHSYCHVLRMGMWLITLRGFVLDTGFIH